MAVGQLVPSSSSRSSSSKTLVFETKTDGTRFHLLAPLLLSVQWV